MGHYVYRNQLSLVVVLLQFSILQGSMVHHVTAVVEVRKLIVIQAAIRHLMEWNQTVLGKPSIVWHRKKLHKIQSAVRHSFCHHRYLKGKKGIIKLQALYRMENIVLFARHDKEIRALVLRVLESRVERLDQHYTTIKDYNLRLLSRLFEAIKAYVQSQTSEWVERYQHHLMILNQKIELYKD
jgi:predicted house-cleaning noncanonical NTP pyrophosphatase (MazG superfamily)